jgi:type III restriction enzyme
MPLKEQERSVVKKGAESDEAYVRRVLGKLASYKDIIVINDEAHHAYRKPAESEGQQEGGGGPRHRPGRGHALDRRAGPHPQDAPHQRCFDLSATPFAPTGKTSTEAALFEWVVSDFGLNDAIEAGW